MRNVVFTLIFLSFGALAQTWKPTDTKGNAGRIFEQVYGSFKTECTRDTDADTTTHNRLGPFTAHRKYLIYCHDGSGAGVACECLQGGASVDNQAASTEGVVLNAGEKVIMTFLTSNLYISCVPYVDNQQYDVCPLDY